MPQTTLNSEVTLTAPNGSPIQGPLDNTQTVYHSDTYRLENTPNGPRLRHLGVNGSDTFIEDAQPATRHGTPLFLAKDGKTYGLNELTIHDTHGNEVTIPNYKILIHPDELNNHLQNITSALTAANWPETNLEAFALGVLLANGMPPEQALPISSSVSVENGECIANLAGVSVPWGLNDD